MTISVEPKRNPPQSNETVYKVYERVREALFALPTYFQSDTSIEGILATDIFTLNAAFGATIEDQVVSTLNRMREVWDLKRLRELVRGTDRESDPYLINALEKILSGIDALLDQR